MSSLPNILVADVNQLIQNVSQTHDKLFQRNKIPIEACTSRITSDCYPAITELHKLIFEDDPAEIFLRLTGHSCVVNYCHQTSTVLWLDKRIIGATLVLEKKYANLAYVYAVIVDAHFHSTWANAYLKTYSFKHLHSCGIEKVAFQALNNNQDTLKQAKKVGAKIEADSYSWNDYQP